MKTVTCQLFLVLSAAFLTVCTYSPLAGAATAPFVGAKLAPTDKNTAVNLLGVVTVLDIPRPVEAQYGDQPPVVSPIPAKHSPEPVFAKWLADLRDLPNADKYNMYFLFIPQYVDIRGSVIPQFQTIEPGKSWDWKPYEDVKTTISIVNPADISKLTPTAKRTTPKDVPFMAIASQRARLPIAPFLALQAGFVDGLVTRMVLEEQRQKFLAMKVDLGDIAGYASSATPILDDSFERASSYPNDKSWDDSIAILMREHPVSATGMIMGWNAGTEIAGENVGDSVEQYKKHRDAIWHLLAARYSLSELGEMVSYTLSYLSAYETSRKIFLQAPSAKKLSADEVIQIAQREENAPAAAECKRLLDTFTRIYLAQYNAIALNPNLPANGKQILLNQYYNFVVGFAGGANKAANLFFIDVFKLAFGLSYESGYQAGFDAGYNAGTSESASVIADLRRQISNMQGGGNGFDHFLSTVGKVADTVSKVAGAIGAIAAFF